jgi:hypothetical protein
MSTSLSGPVEYARHAMFPGLRVQRRQPAAHAHLAAGVADQDLVLDDERRHGDGLTLVQIAELRHPLFLACRRIERDRAVIERVEKDRSIRVDEAAIHHVAAGDALRR